ncbi:hypothetical protein Ctob_001548 [Chrysochromulina tobinii]|uniref:Uncharacterized protein n=1 Tax=Chrysochromulina tobinii TaxID=1460289 RepID=A0A0M0JCK3_9EUKA|nr:hypothetical protein Ctob_001548 [Chrysochromulina tobinii]|eukprot:KOO24210.1 hypothetical protein Ctob_001548 [Chrysochromulina sp. CCMP291]
MADMDAAAASKRPPLNDVSNKGAMSGGYDKAQSAPASDSACDMMVEPESFNLDPLTVRDPQLCHHYTKEIYSYLRDLELEHRVAPQFMQSQRDINATMRGILIDWLVEVAEEYRLESETLYLAVNYIDRFLSHVPVNRSKLQLVGVTCMLVASKYEEIHPPAVDEFVYISDNTYKREEILHMEGMVLNRLNFELSVATAKVFINRFLKAARAGECDSTTEMLCKYLTELTLQEYSFVKYRPSEVAAAALRLALHTMRLPAWTPLLEATSGYSAEDLNGCVAEVLASFRKAETNNLQAVREKYSHAKFLCVSTLTPPDLPP